ncbi:MULTISPECIES: hypothetical protein [Acinetobacter]|uniref:Uncharacterized protein n=1 Tax=Acinetobacter junii TaxID=40215 RepID=A0AAW5RBH1_ACIJU|nr:MULTISPECIES: hypothetical protein [Acinetobacter]MCU4397287.1 hypothetical protein [Acinetobacter junii]MDU2408945.1 hypothetical protein [Acinetobacter junii]
MGLWNIFGSGKGFFSSVSSALGSSFNQSELEEDPTYKKYTAEMSNFKLEDKDAKTASRAKKEEFQLHQMQDELGNIDSIDDVKKYFQEK